jgi:hypothetical protein
MIALFMILTGCQPAADVLTTKIIESPQFQVAVNQAVARKMEEASQGADSASDLRALKGMAKCLSNVKKPYRGVEMMAGRKSVKKCGRIGLGKERPE